MIRMSEIYIYFFFSLARKNMWGNMKEYVENMKNYVKNVKKYVKNMKKF